MPYTKPAGSVAPTGQAEAFRLNIGGKEKKDGWKILSLEEGPDVDFVGDCRDLSHFADGAVHEIYVSHVLEHLGYQKDLHSALKELYRVLADDGRLMVSVPDLETLMRAFLHPELKTEHRFSIMRIIFGEQLSPDSFHRVGLSMEFLSLYLMQAGFKKVERVDNFGLFMDYSALTIAGDAPLSLNVIAYKDN